jgi:hypothetical protein
VSNRISRNFKQTVTHWAITGEGSFSGPTFAAPNVMKGRWDYRNELFRTPAGDEEVSRTIAYLESDVDVGDYVIEGDYSEVSDPTTLPQAFRVKQFQKISDLRNVFVLRKVWL